MRSIRFGEIRPACSFTGRCGCRTALPWDNAVWVAPVANPANFGHFSGFPHLPHAMSAIFFPDKGQRNIVSAVSPGLF